MTNPFSGLGEKAKSFFSDNKHLWIIVVVAILLFGGGLAVGRYTLPAKTVVTEKVKEVTVEKVVVQTKTDVQVVRVKDATQQQRIHRTVVEGIDPPGCRNRTTTEDINVDSVVHDNTNTNTVQYVDRVVEKWQDKIVEKKTEVLRQPNWSVYAGVGLDIPVFLGQDQHGIPGMKGIVVQAGLDRRVVGPFWMGVFGNTEGVLGANLKASW